MELFQGNCRREKYAYFGAQSAKAYYGIPICACRYKGIIIIASRSHAFSIRDIATRAGEGLVHCLQATCSPLQEFLHSQSDCRILPRDVIPPTLLGTASSSAWFRLTRADFLAAYCPVEEARSFSVLELKTQSLSLEDVQRLFWHGVENTAFLGPTVEEKAFIRPETKTEPLLALESKVQSLSWRLVKRQSLSWS